MVLGDGLFGQCLGHKSLDYFCQHCDQIPDKKTRKERLVQAHGFIAAVASSKMLGTSAMK